MKIIGSRQLGFTLVELLVVIAIIGILSSVAVVNLSSARDKAKQVAVLNIFDSLRPVIFLCLSDHIELKCVDQGFPETVDLCNSGTQTFPDVGLAICEGSSVTWPDLTQYGWKYETADAFFSNSDSMTWGVYAQTIDETKKITCTQDNCNVADLP